MPAAPARYSIHDIGFDPDIARNLRIFLDEDVVTDVISYCIESGTIVRYCHHEARSALRSGWVPTETLKGIVRVDVVESE